MINPMGLLALVRGLCRIGGLFVIETVVINNTEAKLIFNAGGVYGGEKSSNYFIVTTGWLDYVLRMLGMRPLQAVYLGNIKKFMRLALLCRSEAQPCPTNINDKWVFANCHKNIFSDESEIDWARLLSTHSDISYLPFNDDNVASLTDGSLFDNLLKIKPYKFENIETTLTFDSVL